MQDFDEILAAYCSGNASVEQLMAWNDFVRSNPETEELANLMKQWFQSKPKEAQGVSSQSALNLWNMLKSGTKPKGG